MHLTFLLRHALVIVLACAAGLAAAEPLTPRQVTSTMRRVADWQIGSWQKDGFKKPKYNWTYCAAYTGILALAAQTREERYYYFVRGIGKDLGWQTGSRR